MGKKSFLYSLGISDKSYRRIKLMALEISTNYNISEKIAVKSIEMMVKTQIITEKGKLLELDVIGYHSIKLRIDQIRNLFEENITDEDIIIILMHSMEHEDLIIKNYYDEIAKKYNFFLNDENVKKLNKLLEDYKGTKIFEMLEYEYISRVNLIIDGNYL